MGQKIVFPVLIQAILKHQTTFLNCCRLKRFKKWKHYL